MESLHLVGSQLWERIAQSMELVEQRLRKTVEVLQREGIEYAVVGGNAVRIWVAQVDRTAVRATADIDILIRPTDLERLKKAMLEAGFFYRQTAGIDMFVEQELESARGAVHVILAGQVVRLDDFEPNPDVEPYELGDNFRTVPLETLVRMKLNSYRLKDKVHLLDMIGVGLLDQTWCQRFPSALADRLSDLIENPNQ
jgi:predicted nucleotidyltransferase